MPVDQHGFADGIVRRGPGVLTDILDSLGCHATVSVPELWDTRPNGLPVSATEVGSSS
jgi:hypothetical protein